MKIYVDIDDVSVLSDLFEATNSYECWDCNRDDNLEIVSLAEYNKDFFKNAINDCIEKNKQIAEQDHQIAVLERALELAVADKCKYENLMVEGIVGKGAKVAIPKKEQWYKEQAESEIKNEKE